MAWEARARGGSYYTRSVRLGGRVTRQYVGTGELARALAYFDGQEQQEREQRRQAARDERDRGRQEEKALADFCRAVENIVRAALTEAGYHRPQRGVWRKRREGEEGMGKVDVVMDARKELAIREAEVPETGAERYAVIQRALGGDKKAEAQALAILRKHTGEFQIMWGSPLNPLLDLVATQTPVMRQIVTNEYEAKIKHVAGEDPTPLERILAERVVVCRMQLAYWERDYAHRINGGLSLDMSEFCQRRIDRAHRRLLASVKALAQVRRLQLPAVQVNIGGHQNIAERQVNISDGG